MKFCYEGYLNLVNDIKEAGYEIVDYHNYRNTAYPCILRHDIDFSIRRAYNMAEIEVKNDIRSTYFVLLTSKMYNPFTKSSRDYIKEIAKMGHEIGLHFDETVYDIKCDDGYADNVAGHILREKSYLEDILGNKIKSVSMHQPSDEFLNRDMVIPGLVNSYSHLFFRDFKYCSDSMREWHFDIQQHLKKKTYPKLHILTHPIWWEKEEKGRDEVLRDLLEQELNIRKNEIHKYYPRV